MRLRILVQRAELPLGDKTEFEDFPNSAEALIPNIGDTVQLSQMAAPEVVKKRHYKFLDSDTLEVRLEI